MDNSARDGYAVQVQGTVGATVLCEGFEKARSVRVGMGYQLLGE